LEARAVFCAARKAMSEAKLLSAVMRRAKKCDLTKLYIFNGISGMLEWFSEVKQQQAFGANYPALRNHRIIVRNYGS